MPQREPCSEEIALKLRSMWLCTLLFSFWFSFSINKVFFLSSSYAKVLEKLSWSLLPWFEARQRPPICCPTKLAPDKILPAQRQWLPSLSRRLRDDTLCTSSSHAHPTKYDTNFGDIPPTANVFSPHFSYKSIGHTAGEVRHQIIRSNTALRLACLHSCYQTRFL